MKYLLLNLNWEVRIYNFSRNMWAGSFIASKTNDFISLLYRRFLNLCSCNSHSIVLSMDLNCSFAFLSGNFALHCTYFWIKYQCISFEY